MPLFVTMLVDSVGAACYGRLAQYTSLVFERHARKCQVCMAALRSAVLGWRFPLSSFSSLSKSASREVGGACSGG